MTSKRGKNIWDPDSIFRVNAVIDILRLSFRFLFSGTGLKAGVPEQSLFVQGLLHELKLGS